MVSTDQLISSPGPLCRGIANEQWNNFLKIYININHTYYHYYTMMDRIN